MRLFCASIIVLSFAWASGTMAAAQTPASMSTQPPSASAPTLVRIDGQLKAPTGEARTGSVAMAVSLYADKDDAAPLWVEQQVVTLDAAGRYTLFAGATLPDGVPAAFLSGATAGHWLGVGPQGEAEQFRMMLVTVPYALKAREADTLGGKSLSDFVLTENLSETAKASLKAQGVGLADKTSVNAAGSVPGIAGLAGALLRDDGAGGISSTSSVLVDDGLGNVTVRPLTGVASKIRFWNALGNNETVIRDVGPSGQSELVFEPGLNERLRIKFSGGADLYGNLLLRPLAGAASKLRLWNAGSTNETYIRDVGIAGASVLAFEPGGVEQMRVNSNGNVGIGIASPTFRLHLVDPSNTGLRVQTNSSGGTVASFGGNGDFQIDAPNVVGGRLAVKSDGRVGVGTNSPLAKLDLQGGADNNGTNDPQAIAFQWRGGGYRHWIRTRHSAALGAGNAIDFFVNDSASPNGSTGPGLGSGSAHVMTLDSGRVGIGTPTPTERLTVEGTVQSTSGGFKFPDGSVQTTAASGSTTYTIRHTSSETPVTVPPFAMTNILHLNVPPGTYLLWATVEFINTASGGGNNSRNLICSFTGGITEEYPLSLPGSSSLTGSFHSVSIIGALEDGVDLFCGATGNDNALQTRIRRLTAVKIEGNVVVQ